MPYISLLEKMIFPLGMEEASTKPALLVYNGFILLIAKKEHFYPYRSM
jgi:hypothetical protein